MVFLESISPAKCASLNTLLVYCRADAVTILAWKGLMAFKLVGWSMHRGLMDHLMIKETARKYLYNHSLDPSRLFFACISPTLTSFHCCLSFNYLWKMWKWTILVWWHNIRHIIARINGKDRSYISNDFNRNTPGENFMLRREWKRAEASAQARETACEIPTLITCDDILRQEADNFQTIHDVDTLAVRNVAGQVTTAYSPPRKEWERTKIKAIIQSKSAFKRISSFFTIYTGCLVKRNDRSGKRKSWPQPRSLSEEPQASTGVGCAEFCSVIATSVSGVAFPRPSHLKSFFKAATLWVQPASPFNTLDMITRPRMMQNGWMIYIP